MLSLWLCSIQSSPDLCGGRLRRSCACLRESKRRDRCASENEHALFHGFSLQCYCSDMVWNPLQTVNRAAFDEAAPVKVRQRSRRRYSTNFLSRPCAEKLSRVERFATFANVRDTWLLRPIPSSLPSW